MVEKLDAALARVDAWIRRLAHACACLSAVGLFGIVALLTLSSLKRYVLHTPIEVTEELGGLLFMATTFLALTEGFVRGRHVRLELLWRRLPSPWREATEVVGQVLVLIGVGVVVRETWFATTFSYQLGGRSVMTNLLLWPWRLVMPATLSLFSAAVAVRALRTVLSLAAARRAQDR